MPNRQKLKQIELAIQNAKDYQEYYQACEYHDQLSGADEWKAQDKSKDYDYRLIRKRLQRMQVAMANQDPASLMSILHEGIHGNLGNIANPNLVFHSKTGTKETYRRFPEYRVSGAGYDLPG